MTKQPQHPWASGPGEILRHGLTLLKQDTDTNRRLAMISIDNSVELMVKTFLGLPTRVTGLAISRKELQEISESFPALLDAVERHASDKLVGIDLGTIEWYHRLRNELYHQGNGLTVERDKVEVYAELANLLFKNLFGVELVEHVTPRADLLGDFIQAWVALEQGLTERALDNSLVGTRRSPLDSARFLENAGIISKAQLAEIDTLRRLRSEVLHGVTDSRQAITEAIVARVKELATQFGAD
jgi:hypothetical protein